MFPNEKVGIIETVKRIKIGRVKNEKLPAQDQQEHRSEQPCVNRTTANQPWGLGVCELS